ncbi:acylneuraminate cytidylyltransferase family protein (plasmid) [Sulfitobacter sp. TCYB15]|uniref:Acylneuraminate cytidylyltransferase family protein n=1 Tax=Sulfitobacter sp. TCYB15 TaxID=3229275 RepID=A0AAU8CA63_9RHOB
MTHSLAPLALALIPVRAGSKGLPGKNVRPFAGRPLYEHAVQQGCTVADRCIVSTDIADIIASGGPPGCDVRVRPANLAGDTAPMDAVITDAIVDAGLEAGTMVLLQATSPLRRNADIAAAVALYRTGAHNLVMSVSRTDPGPLKYGFMTDGTFCPVSGSRFCFANRQALPPLFRPNGAVYVFDIAWFLCNGSLATDRIGAVEMDASVSLDVDTLADFERAEALYLSSQARDKPETTG